MTIKTVVHIPLEREGPEGHSIQVTKEMIIAAAQNHRHGKGLVETILLAGEGDGNVPVTQLLESVIHTASMETMVLLLDKYGVREITDKIIFGAIRNFRDGTEIIELLHQKYDITDRITERLLVSAAGHGAK